MLMKHTGEDFTIHFNDADKKIVFAGSMRLWDAEGYGKISKFLLDVYELDLDSVTLDFRKLEFLNSAGINMLCKFVIHAKNRNKMRLRIIGNKDILWQVKSFANLKLLWPDITIDFK
jgi:hypothetical protein